MAILAVLLWAVGELHYRDCVGAAKASPRTESRWDEIGRQVDDGALEREIRSCSRLPFSTWVAKYPVPRL